MKERYNRAFNNIAPEKSDEELYKAVLGKAEDSMSKNIFKKSMVSVATVAACFCLVGITTLAATDKLEGFFKDIKRWDGAVIGTLYEQATDEIVLSVIAVSDELIVTAEMVEPNVFPYVVFETIGIEDYDIVDANGMVAIKGEATEFAEVFEGKTTISIPISGLPSGNYRLVVSGFVGSSKADQPMVLNGSWECEFAR